MYIRSPKIITLIFLLLLIGVSTFVYYPKYQAEKVMQERLNALLSGPSRELHLDLRIKSSGCVPNGALPDHDCTPGAIFTDANIEHICLPGYSRKVRRVTKKMRKAVFAEYEISYPQLRGTLEVDHLIPLVLGGNNDIANLWTEAAEPTPGFKEKDIVEIYLQEEVCAGHIPLSNAQEQIASNWLTVYNNLPPEQIEQIKTKFHSWAQ